MTHPDPIRQACLSQGVVTVEVITAPAHKLRLANQSMGSHSVHLAAALQALGITASGLWLHQAKSLAAIAAGKNLVLATGTASGKSLVFQSAILSSLLAGESTHLVFYPQKALAADQMRRWVAALKRAGLPASWVAEINGDVPMAAREQAVAEARILLVTPDVVHAWMMRSLAVPAVHAFLAHLHHIVIDEAHALEGPFGSSAAFLIRRLLLARGNMASTHAVQFIAATATIANPCQHLEALTGLPFVLVGEADNGAACAPKAIVHIEGANQASAREAQVAAIARELTQTIGEDAFIVFVDSRQGVERITRRIADPCVLPYRSGYEAHDRRRIEEALRAGHLRGVIATSALELGIDIPQFVVGINVGMPQSRKALHQRIGRVGRAKPGTFLVMTPACEFTKLGTTFAEFYTSTVEPSHLYLENRYIQYAQARCLVEEELTSDPEGPLPGHWPDGFAAMLAAARPGGRRPADLDTLAAAGGDCPHLNYPLRQIASENLELKLAGVQGSRIGTIATHQAIREAYPGATYYHLQKPYKVTEWRVNSYERSIGLRAVRDAEPTQPILRQWVNGSLDAGEVIDGRFWQAANGHAAEASLQVLEAVEGYRAGTKSMLYRELAAANPRIRRQQRDFSTTGVLLQIAEPWFAGPASEQTATRKTLASALTELLCRELSIAPVEIAWAHTGVALCSPQGARKADDAIAIYDNVRGGLRLSGPLLDLLPAFARRLQKAADIAADAALVDKLLAGRFAAWVASLKAVTPAAASSIEVPPGECLIFAPGSDVSFRTRGQTIERRILEPKLMATPDGGLLFYRYEADEGVTAWVAHDAVEPLGQHWSRAIWNPETNTIRNCA